MLGHLKKNKMEKSGFAISLQRCILPPLRVLSCIETLIDHVMCLKELIAHSEPLSLLRLNGRVGVIPT